MPESKNSIAHIDTLLQQGELLFQQKDYETAALRWHDAVRRAEKENYHGAVVKANTFLAKLFRFKADYKTAVVYGKQALRVGKKKATEELLLTVHQELADSLLMLRQYALAGRQYRLALNMANRYHNLRAQTNIHLQLTWLHRSTGNIKTALTCAHKALQMAMLLGDTKIKAVAYMQMGVLCGETGNDDIAIEYHLQAVRTFEEAGLPQQVANTLDNVAQAFEARGQWNKGEEYRLKALELRKKGVNKYIRFFAHLNMASMYANTNRYKQAEEQLQIADEKAMDSFRFESNFFWAELYQKREQWQKCIETAKRYIKERDKTADSYSLAVIHLRIGECYTALKKYASAKKYLNSALRLAEKQQAHVIIEKIFQVLSEWAKMQNMHKEALAFYQKYTNCHQKRVNINSEYRMLLLQLQFETERKDAEIARLKNEIYTLNDMGDTSSYGLSPREQEILKRLVQGESYKAMAHGLGITYETVRTYIKRLYTKLGVNTNTEAVAKAMGEKLVVL